MQNDSLAIQFAQNVIFSSEKNNLGQEKKRTFVVPTLLARSRTPSSICSAETRRKTKMAARDIVVVGDLGGAAARGRWRWNSPVGLVLFVSAWIQSLTQVSSARLDISWPLVL